MVNKPFPVPEVLLAQGREIAIAGKRILEKIDSVFRSYDIHWIMPLNDNVVDNTIAKRSSELTSITEVEAGHSSERNLDILRWHIIPLLQRIVACFPQTISLRRLRRPDNVKNNRDNDPQMAILPK